MTVTLRIRPTWFSTKAGEYPFDVDPNNRFDFGESLWEGCGEATGEARVVPVETKHALPPAHGSRGNSSHFDDKGKLEDNEH